MLHLVLEILQNYFLYDKNLSNITCVEPNEKIFRKEITIYKFKNIKWIKSTAENLPVGDNVFDFYSISYGIRNVSDNKTLREAYRVCKAELTFYVFKFSKINNELLNFYKNYSKVIPALGRYIESSKPYEYLFNSIDTFYNQNNF